MNVQINPHYLLKNMPGAGILSGTFSHRRAVLFSLGGYREWHHIIGSNYITPF